MHHYEELVEMIEMDALLVIFGARNEKIIILQIKGEVHVISSTMQPMRRSRMAQVGPHQQRHAGAAHARAGHSDDKAGPIAQPFAG